MRLSVIVCTRDRAASLRRTLDALARCAPPLRADWQLVVVDNGSRDDTPRTLEAFRERLPLRALREPRGGLSLARNTGLAAADGDYLLWTDDDVTPGADWLRGYEDAFAAHPQAAFFGGPIRPRFEGKPPGWLAQSWSLVENAYASLDFGAPAPRFDASSRVLPYGANLAIRAAEQRAFPYDPSLGRSPQQRIRVNGEESDVLRRIVAAGGTGVWVPKAAVEHWIDPTRQTTEYLRRYYVGIGYLGRCQALAQGRATGLGPRLRLVRRLAWQETVYVGARLLGRPQRWVPALRDAALLRGRLFAHRRALAGSTASVTPGDA